MPLSPYVAFAGNCADAIAYYQQTLNAELLYRITFGEMPKDDDEHDDGCVSGQTYPDTAIAHANLRISGSCIMMSDSAESGNTGYSGFTLVLDVKDPVEGKRWFDDLAAEGHIDVPWQVTFWAHGFGKVTDRYGVPWMVNVVKQPAA